MKKKCDEQKPLCGRCKRRGRIECVWHSDLPLHRCSTAKGSPERLQHAISSSPLPRAGANLRTSASALDSLQINRSLPSLYSSRLTFPDMPDVPANCILDLIQLGNRVLHGAYFDDRYTLLSYNLPKFADSPTLLYAWLSLCAMQAAHQQHDPANSPWLRIALSFHSKALHGLAVHLTSSQSIADWALCSIIILHVYEKLDDHHQPPCFAHISTARAIFLKRLTSSPESLYQVLQFDCLVYRLAVISTFHPAVLTHFECVSELAEISISSRFNDHGLWRHSLWASVPLTIYDTVFKLSFLLRQQPLNLEWAFKLDQLEARLKSHRQVVAVDISVQDSSRRALLAEQASAAQDLYTHACLVIVAKLRYNAVIPSSTTIQQASEPGFRTLDHLAEIKFLSPVLLWPACILGLAAQSPANRLSITNYVRNLAPNTGLRSTRSVLRLLYCAWDPDHGELGLDILFNEQLSSLVFL